MQTIKKECRCGRDVKFEVPEPPRDETGERIAATLKPKELRIVAMVVEGCRNREIAAALGTSEQVIKNYLRGVFNKVGADGRLDLGIFVVRHPALLSAVEAANSES